MVDVDIEEVGQVAPGTPLPPWSTRIPAEIKHAKELLNRPPTPGQWYIDQSDPEHPSIITAGEAALAEALWKTYRTLNTESGEEHWPVPLIAFTEKAEKLT